MISLLCIAFAVHSAGPRISQDGDESRRDLDQLSTKDERRILDYLANRCDGRGTGQEGFHRAAKFVADEFKQIGLKPIEGNDGYFQPATVDSSRSRYAIEANGKRVRIDAADCQVYYKGNLARLTPDRLEKTETINAAPIFLSTDGAAWPERLDLKGKILFWRHSGEEYPPERVFDEMDSAAKVSNVEVSGSGLPILTALVPGFAGFWCLDSATKLSANTLDAPVACYRVTDRVERQAMDLSRVPRLEQPPVGGVSVSTGTQPISFVVDTKQIRWKAENVVGMLLGSDPKLKDEYVVVSAHLDHFGKQKDGVYRGADDDGSGATAVIEIARAMATGRHRPRRSVLFVTFFGEELGLLGSRYFAKNCPVPLHSLVADLQMDMIGRDSDGPQQQPDASEVTIDKASENRDTVRVIYGPHPKESLSAQIRQNATKVGLRLLSDAEYNFGRSDDAVFAKLGIPTAWWFTGYHPDYHRPTDTTDKIDWEKLAAITRHVYLTALSVADQK